MKLKIVTLLFSLLFSSAVYAQELDPLPISIGKLFESAVTETYADEGVVDAKLVNIWTSPYISIANPATNQPYAYNFITEGDFAGYASLWIATYYDAAADWTLSFTFAALNGTPIILTWPAPMTEVLKGVVYSGKTPVNTTAEQFKEFILSQLDSIKTKMNTCVQGIAYFLGAGVPESIEIRGEKMSFNENETIYYSQFLMTEAVGDVDMCYQYFDSTDISCNTPNFIVDQSITDNVSLYPNPASADFTFSFDLQSSGTLNITLIDILGNDLLELYNGFAPAGNFIERFSLAGLPAGVYYLKVEQNGRAKLEKIVQE